MLNIKERKWEHADTYFSFSTLYKQQKHHNFIHVHPFSSFPFSHLSYTFLSPRHSLPFLLFLPLSLSPYHVHIFLWLFMCTLNPLPHLYPTSFRPMPPLQPQRRISKHWTISEATMDHNFLTSRDTLQHHTRITWPTRAAPHALQTDMLVFRDTSLPNYTYLKRIWHVKLKWSFMNA